MASLEKRAWFQLGVVAMTIVTWLLLFSVTRSVAASMAAFALLGLTGLPGPNRVRTLNDRDREIAESAFLAAAKCWFAFIALVPLVAGFAWGWETRVELGLIAQVTWAGWIVVLLVRSAMTIRLYAAAR